LPDILFGWPVPCYLLLHHRSKKITLPDISKNG
jgi:hypothetical protein